MSVPKTFIVVVGGTVTVSVGGYALIQLDRANKLAQELSRISDQAKSVNNSYELRESEIRKKEEAVGSLSVQVEAEMKKLEELGVRVKNARQELQRVERLWQKKQDFISEMTRERNDARLAISNLRTLTARDQETLATLNRELSEHQLKVAEARSLINPLNHPEVKKLIGKA